MGVCEWMDGWMDSECGTNGEFRRVDETVSSPSSRRAAATAAAAARVNDGSMRAVSVAAQSTVVWLGFFAQGLLGGFGALNLFMTYLLDAPNLPRGNVNRDVG